MSIIDNQIYETFKNLTSVSWSKFNQDVRMAFEDVRKEIDSIKESYPDIRQLITEELIFESEKELTNEIIRNLKNRKSSIITYMEDKFKEIFNFDANGALRNWKILDDGIINKQFSNSYDLFKDNLKCLESPLTFELNGEIIFKTEETDKLRASFKKKANDVLEQAFNKKYNRNALQNVPKWLWVILAFFAHDNIISWLSHPLIFLFLILACMALGYIFATG